MEDFNIEIRTSYQTITNLGDIVDKDVQSMLYPLKVMQIMVLCPKYRMKNNSIKPNNLFNMFVLVFGLIIFLTAYMYRFTEILVDENLQRYGSNQFLYFASYYDFVYYSSGFIMNLVLHCIHTKKIVSFVLTFQEVHRFLNRETSFNWCIIRNWINVIIIFAFYVVTVLFLTLVFNQQRTWYFVLSLIFLFSLDANLIYAMSLVKLLTDKVELWKVKVLISSINEQGENDEMACNKMFKAYLHILKCYDITKIVFQQPVLYQTVETFFRCLINVQVMIEFRRPFFVITPSASVLLYFWIIKTLVLQFALSLQVETFYDAVNLAQDSCSSILASYCTNDQKNLCKNIQRVHRASFSKMTACGLFYVDICQPFRLMALLTNYTVVLLQFAFL